MEQQKERLTNKVDRLSDIIAFRSWVTNALLVDAKTLVLQIEEGTLPDGYTQESLEQAVDEYIDAVDAIGQ